MKLLFHKKGINTFLEQHNGVGLSFIDKVLDYLNISYKINNKHIYLIKYDDTPTLLNKISRLREYSFRKVGEGSGQHKDLDHFDEYYQHLVLWDDDALEIVGAYRIGECNWILSWLGKEGLYLNSLCQINDTSDAYLEGAIELGRSFVQPRNWGTGHWTISGRVSAPT